MLKATVFPKLKLKAQKKGTRSIHNCQVIVYHDVSQARVDKSM